MNSSPEHPDHPAGDGGNAEEDPLSGSMTGVLNGPVDHVRLVEAVLFSAPSPVPPRDLRALLPESADLDLIMSDLAERYAGRGVILTEAAGGYAFRTAPDLTPHLRTTRQVFKKPGRAAIETLAIIAYHQPVTRAEIEDLRGVATNKGTLDALIHAGWIKPGGRRRSPGRPLTWATTDGFLAQFDLGSLDDLPALEELKAAGMLDRDNVSDRPDDGHEGGPDRPHDDRDGEGQI
ncbi:SMC-Scp complex subunit ScpB [Fodinicurvata sp. EGI_FJ10296]|uniref:SMC-Scp complex subunit ScpB n=1 Tax=Fodinicurvata sp. EGI_FJ10296 TaxID=3231908 RepID=UPI00345258F1